MTKKTCTKCTKVKDLREFFIIKKTGKHRPECKKCSNEMTRKYKAKNKAHISEYNGAYKEEHKEEVKVYNHDYNRENREAIQKRQTKQHRERKETDANYKITCELRTKLCSYVKSLGSSNVNFIEDLVGCNWEDFELWFIYLFDEKMTFENHGSYWTIDHVNPCHVFDLTDPENQYECFHWTNLRPCKKLQNQEKTGKVDKKLIKNHAKMAKEFIDALPKNIRNNYTMN